MIYSEKYFHQKTVRTAAPPRKQEPYTKDGTEGRRCFSVNENSINLDSKPCSKIKYNNNSNSNNNNNNNNNNSNNNNNNNNNNKLNKLSK